MSTSAIMHKYGMPKSVEQLKRRIRTAEHLNELMVAMVDDLVNDRVSVEVAQACFNGCWKIVMVADLIRKHGDFNRNDGTYDWEIFPSLKLENQQAQRAKRVLEED